MKKIRSRAALGGTSIRETGNEINVAVVGIGNCASSLVQGAHFYVGAEDDAPGLVHAKIGRYRVDDIRFVAAFDVDPAKVGHDLSKAIFAGQNNADAIADVPHLDCPVEPGPKLDGVGSSYEKRVSNAVSDGRPRADIVSILRDREVDVIVNFLPVGSQEATEWWAETALEAGCAFVNSIPVFVGRKPEWRDRFAEANLPLLGDDIKSQLGATIVHRMLAHLFASRGVRLDRTYQLNVGGNMDFWNMLERDRLDTKKQSKGEAVTDALPYMMGQDDVHIGPSDYVPWLGDHKLAFIRCEGTAFGGMPLSIELKMDVVDSPNSAGVVVDAIRVAKVALDRDDGAGAMRECAPLLFKAPPYPVASDGETVDRFNAWIDRPDPNRESRRPAGPTFPQDFDPGQAANEPVEPGGFW